MVDARVATGLVERRRSTRDRRIVVCALTGRGRGDLDWMATILAGLVCPFRVNRPQELRESVRALASRLVDSV
jgi:DNA-binding MarR family transcriptional regulator